MDHSFKELGDEEKPEAEAFLSIFHSWNRDICSFLTVDADRLYSCDHDSDCFHAFFLISIGILTHGKSNQG